jgi:hypothetical protein
LYAGPDHLLQVTSNGFTESYQRFFFQDIQAITLCHTVESRVWSILLGVGAAFFVLLTTASDNPTAQLILFSLAAVPLVMLVINMALGPTCRCYLKTAVQTQKIPALKRVRRARKIISTRIQPLIIQAQGEMSLEELNGRLDPAGGRSTYQGAVPPTTGTQPAL